ncbi:MULTISPECIES: DUF5673 domain-containing protein [Nostoc]|uniref:DUF5673 domain-containing protein n=1 Tax=Nostoc paludosum FACHB-159 TaxID=2692908 RepID=A0ABR8KGD8_9NOSO|nr:MULTISPECIES: DUF5673 domain-containing protein [Nostoc]MBD2681305.1 hypothetical protein [Nostoc sp. FACHB-857]MBD2737784.1 hypothetical protein [Nostoc paludosum FACHB-159]
MNTFGFTHIASLAVSTIVLVVFLAIRYQLTRRLVGKQDATREILYALIWILLVSAILFIPQLTRYSWLILLGIYAVCFLGYLIYISTWYWRKQQAGYYLLNVRTAFKNKRLAWLILLSIIFAILYSALFIREAFNSNSISNNLNNSYVAEIILLWSSVIILISRYFSEFELRENGICYMFSLVKWEDIKSYRWEKTKNNILIVSFQAHFPLVKTYWRVTIPLAQKYAVEQILAQYLNNHGSQHLILPTDLSHLN